MVAQLGLSGNFIGDAGILALVRMLAANDMLSEVCDWGGAAVRVARACACAMPSLAFHSSRLADLLVALIRATH